MNDQKRTALVTGANKGIGFETARQLAQRGFTVWLGCRDEERGVTAARELAQDGDVRFVRLDVTDEQSVRAAAARVEQDTGALDVLVNNAAIALAGDGLASEVALEAVRGDYEVNVLGVLSVTQAFLPLVKRAQAGRIVMVSSSMGSLGLLTMPNSPLLDYPSAFAYSSSKSALSSITAHFAVELRDTPIKVNAVCPGYNATDLNQHRGTQHPSEGAKVVVGAATLDASGPTGTFFAAEGPRPW